MDSIPMAAEIILGSLNLQQYDVPTKHFQGKSLTFSTALLVLLVLGFACSVFCNEFPMASVPLGFEFSRSDRTRLGCLKIGFFASGFLEGYRRADDIDGFVVGIRQLRTSAMSSVLVVCTASAASIQQDLFVIACIRIQSPGVKETVLYSE
ncbi:hypothetical protein V6N12_000502 [Hibiscus sabdariffa]